MKGPGRARLAGERGGRGWGVLHRLPERPFQAGWVSGSKWSGLRWSPWAGQRPLEEPGMSAGSGGNSGAQLERRAMMCGRPGLRA